MISIGNAMKSSAESKRKREERKLKYNQRMNDSWNQGQKKLTQIINDDSELSELIVALNEGISHNASSSEYFSLFSKNVVERFDYVVQNDLNSNYFESNLISLYKDLSSSDSEERKERRVLTVVPNLYDAYQRRKR